MAEDKESKKHPASEQKKRQLKKKGQVPKSQDVPMALGLVAAFGTIMALKGTFSTHFSGLMRVYFSSIVDVKKPAGIDLKHLMLLTLKEILMLSLPVLLAVMIVGVISHVGQSGLIFSAEPLTPKLSKLNPMTKIKAWFSIKSAQDLVKSLVKMLAAGYVGWLAWKGAMGAISSAVMLSPVGLLALGGTVIKSMFIKVILLYIIVAAVDFAFQRKNFAKDNKMTDKEVKDEYKNSEGDPYQKAKRRQMAQQISMSQSTEYVPDSDVVVVNPTELAIALKYDPEISPVPYVVAKGDKRLADDIRESARNNGVPVVRNKPLARALFELCEIGDIVPAELFRPVAEVLAYVFALNEEATPGDAAQAANQAAQQVTTSSPEGIHEMAHLAVPTITPAGTASGAGMTIGSGPILAAPINFTSPAAHVPTNGTSQQSIAPAPAQAHSLDVPMTGDPLSPGTDSPFTWAPSDNSWMFQKPE